MRLEEMWIIETGFESKRRKGKAAGKKHIEDTQKGSSQRLKCSRLYCIW